MKDYFGGLLLTGAILVSVVCLMEPALAEKEGLEWMRTDTSIALENNGKIVWQYNHGPEFSKPHFHPLGLADGTPLTWQRPPDHVWHLGLWFSWKFINGLNYWEEDPGTGLSQGRTEVSRIEPESRPDGSATIRLALEYHPPEEPAVLKEERTLQISAPDSEGVYWIDWEARFTAWEGGEVLLDRTPILGEPEGKDWGGYAGLSLRLSERFPHWEILNSEGGTGVEGTTANRADWCCYSLPENSETQASVAIFEAPTNPRHPTTWYTIQRPETPFGFFTPALLYREPMTLAPGEELELRYRILIAPKKLAGMELEERYRRYIEKDSKAESALPRWSKEKAAEWYASQAWPVGCNFLPSTAINQLEMWQEDTFDPLRIDRELEWAAGIGMNSARVFLHNLLWDQDREGFLRRMEKYLEIADHHGISTLFVPLDGVWDPNPKLGKQPEPRPHVHNSGWVQAPGAEILANPDRHGELEGYIRGVISHFRSDPRILGWDLFNEPENLNHNSYGAGGEKTEIENKVEMATRLLPRLFQWARAENPTQPLTTGVWRIESLRPDTREPIVRTMLEESDILSFHSYGNLESLMEFVDLLEPLGRPILCTEYMARGNQSTFDPLLGYFKENKIGAYNWGLVAGKSQTQYPWETWEKNYTAEPTLWHHDIFRPNGTPYAPNEIRYFRQITGKH
jgi:hypothetical protein